MQLRQKISVNLLVLTLGVFILAGCGGSSSSSSDSNDSADNGGTDHQDLSKYVVLDAASDTSQAAHLDLNSGHNVIESEGWHFAYQKYVGFKVNESVSACIAKSYPAIFDSEGNAVQSEFEALTKDSTLDDFEAVTATSCTEFISDAAESQFSDWYTYDSTSHQITVHSDNTNGWIVRSSAKDTTFTEAYNYARIKVKSYAGTIVFEAEMYDHNTNTFAAAVDTPEMDFSEGTSYWDMETNQVATSEMAGWDLKIVKEGYGHGIYMNGGVSGDGDAGVGTLLVSSVDDVTNPADTAQVYKYFEDAAKGAMSEPGSYGPIQYGVAGGHKMWPTFSVYLFKDGDNYYKAQVISNYGEDGTLASANLYIRYAEVTP